MTQQWGKGWEERRSLPKGATGSGLLGQLTVSDRDTEKGNLLEKEKESWWGQVGKNKTSPWLLHHSSWPELVLRNLNLSGYIFPTGKCWHLTISATRPPNLQWIQGHWERLSCAKHENRRSKFCWPVSIAWSQCKGRSEWACLLWSPPLHMPWPGQGIWL